MFEYNLLDNRSDIAIQLSFCYNSFASKSVATALSGEIHDLIYVRDAT